MPELRGLRSKSFAGIALTQLFTSFNDNAYRWLIIPIGIAILGTPSEGGALSVGLAAFVVPYVLLLSPAGYLADRFPKRSVMSACMALQALILVAGVSMILLGHVGGMYGALALMGAQGAILSPAKGGAIPESVREDRVSAANGVCGLAAVAAAVIGTVVGNALYVMSMPRGRRLVGVYTAVMVGTALLGLAATRLVERHPAADPSRAFPRNLLRDTLGDVRGLWRERRLFGVACASAYFWFVASLAQVNVYLFATTDLRVGPSLVGPLLGLLALGAALGAVSAGVWSKDRVRLELCPVSALGMAVCGVLIDVVPTQLGARGAYVTAGLLLLAMGFSAGLYDVPLQSYLQVYSRPERRGKVLATSTAMMFSAMLIAAGAFWLMRSALGRTGGSIFLALGIVTLPVALVLFAFFSPRGLRWRQRVMRRG